MFCDEERLRRIEHKVDRTMLYVIKILKEEKLTMATLADLDAELAKSDTSVAAIQADTATIIGKLQTGGTVDVSAQLAHLQTVNAALSAVLASEDAAITPVPVTPTA